ncbi:MAG: hypothetical protein IPL33_13035 [Sphingobacteriales bacterium]|nr:hypothetical protein [Sphingobacteriales bacterium]
MGGDATASVCNDISEGTGAVDLSTLVGVSGGVFSAGWRPPFLTVGHFLTATYLALGDYVYEYTVSGGGLCSTSIALITISVTDCALCPNPPTHGLCLFGQYLLFGRSLDGNGDLRRGRRQAIPSAVPGGLGDRCATGAIDIAASSAAFIR